MPRGRTGLTTDTSSYATRSAEPLHGLVLLLPFIIAYELASIAVLRSGDPGSTLRAERLLAVLFDSFGLPGVALPALAIVAIMLVHHVSLGRRWRVRPGTVVGMAAESLAWTIPLLVLGQVLVRILGGGAGVPRELAALAAGTGGGDVSVLGGVDWREAVTIAIGAGLFEELIFRMALIALLHFALHDICLVPSKAAGWLSVIVSSAAFAWYHEPWGPAGLDVAAAGFFFVAGMGFAGLYLWRGFGIVAATHALYDLIVLLVLPAIRSSG